ncbi:MAG TPA: hypothetical protein VFV03_07305 [Solirubrobacteraceae bacterium]|nr:hypothetical protein [Solirubrobacteraceae bacterium]
MAPSALGAMSIALVCCGCQSTAEKSTELEKHAKHQKLALQGVSVTRDNPDVKVLQSTVVHSSVGTAVVMELRNTSRHALENAPIEITVRDAKGVVLFQNNQPGLEPSLTKVSLLMPGAETMWVDDQVQVAGVPATASARVGEAAQVRGIVPQLSVSSAKPTGEAGGEAGEAGTVTNKSTVAQAHVVVYAVARRAGKIVAAGRAVLPEVGPGASVPFQVYFVGDPSGGAQIQTSAPATSF